MFEWIDESLTSCLEQKYNKRTNNLYKDNKREQMNAFKCYIKEIKLLAMTIINKKYFEKRVAHCKELKEI